MSKNSKKMNKGLIAFSVIPFAVVALLFMVFSTDHKLDVCDYKVDDLALNFNVKESTANLNPSTEISDACFITPKLGKTFVGYKEALAFKESRGNYFTVNTLGYLGKYQFGKGTLKLIGVHNTNIFLENPELQEKAFIANLMRNKWVLRRDIKRFVGMHIDGVLVTESGILAAAHLAGPGSVKKYLRSYGAVGFTDAYGTTVRNYMNRFSGFDTSFIKANKKAKVSLL